MTTKHLGEFEPDHGFTIEDWEDVSDNPPITPELLAKARPFAEMLPALAASIRRTRGRQKTPTKQLVSLRIDRDVLDTLKAGGAGWQSRINNILRKATQNTPI